MYIYIYICMYINIIKRLFGQKWAWTQISRFTRTVRRCKQHVYYNRVCAFCTVKVSVEKNETEDRLDLYFLPRTNTLTEWCYISRRVSGCIFYIENIFIILYIATWYARNYPEMLLYTLFFKFFLFEFTSLFYSKTSMFSFKLTEALVTDPRPQTKKCWR